MARILSVQDIILISFFIILIIYLYLFQSEHGINHNDNMTHISDVVCSSNDAPIFHSVKETLYHGTYVSSVMEKYKGIFYNGFRNVRYVRPDMRVETR